MDVQILIAISMTVTMFVADEKQLAVKPASADRGCISVFADLFKSLKKMPPSMFKVLAVTAITWVPSTS